MRSISLALVSKLNHPKQYPVNKSFLYKKQGFVNWFMYAQFLVITRTECQNVEKLRNF